MATADLFLHLTCAFLVASMLMNSLRTLRMLALAAGVSAILYFAVGGKGGPVLIWASLFLLVNGAQLVLMQLRRRRLANMPPEERELLDQILRVEEPAHQRRLIGLLAWRDAGEGEVLITQGEASPPLIYVASGSADISHEGKLVGTCGVGDFLGDMNMVTGEVASATVTVTEPMRIACIDRGALADLSNAAPEVGAAFDRALNRGLAAKIRRMNLAAAEKS